MEEVIKAITFIGAVIFFFIALLSFALGEWQASIASSLLCYLQSKAFIGIQ